MSTDRPRRTPQAGDLFMALWSQRMFSETGAKPGASTWTSAQIVHWAKVWVDCCDLAGRLEEMEEKAAAAEAEPPTWG